MHKTVVLNIVGLSERVIGDHTPFIKNWLQIHSFQYVRPQVPAVTCTQQSNYLTGKTPAEHGIVGNGWYFKAECEVKFWRQSNKLVTAPKIWDQAKEIDPSFTCANLFWWYNMYSEVNYSVTPRPNYLADGRKIPDVYSHPAQLRDELQKEYGQFPLFEFWGPNTSIRSSRWIANAARFVDQKYDPTLSLVYLPHLDYCLQKYGHQHAQTHKDLSEIDGLCEELISYYQSRNTRILILSEYGISEVNRWLALNVKFRGKGWLQVREERGRELLDPGASRVFAVADHQIAHIYLKDPNDLQEVRTYLMGLEGVGQVWDKEEQLIQGLHHSRSGDLVVVAAEDCWFTYYYWQQAAKAPDFARTVDIHRKPGYDPVEMFADPQIKALKPLIAWKLLRKKLGFRTLMDVIPLDPSLIKGSHGAEPESTMDWPLVIGEGLENGAELQATKVYDIIWRNLMDD